MHTYGNNFEIGHMKKTEYCNWLQSRINIQQGSSNEYDKNIIRIHYKNEF